MAHSPKLATKNGHEDSAQIFGCGEQVHWHSILYSRVSIVSVYINFLLGAHLFLPRDVLFLVHFSLFLSSWKIDLGQ